MNAEEILYTLTAYLTDPNVITNAITILAICLGCFLLGSLLRLLFGKNCTAVKSVTVVFGVLILYLAVFALRLVGDSFESYLPSLPFAAFGGDYISVSSITTMDQTLLWAQLVDLIVLVVIMGLIDDLLPRGKNLFVWLLLRCVTITGSAVAFTLVNRLMNAILPGVVLQYAPIILLLLLALFLAVTIFKWLIGIILGVSGGPVLGAIYTFFISHLLGKQLTKAALSSGILMGLVYLAEHYGTTVIVFPDPMGLFLIPAILLLFLVWYLVNKLF